MKFLKLPKGCPPLWIGQNLADAAVAELTAFTKERLFDLITEDRLIMYVHDVMGEKDLSSAVIQRTMRCMEESDHASIKKWKVWRNCGLPLLALARHQEEFALPYLHAAIQEAKRCVTFWKRDLDTIMEGEVAIS
jgi:hypothetical protein